MEQLLISGARHLRLPTAFGIKKIMRNILALQQSIKTLTNDQQNTEFDKAKRYYLLFNVSPQVRLLFYERKLADRIKRKCWMAFGRSRSSLLTNTKRC
jgi:exocyst complex component 4